jgi:2-methylcitrate dehydratase PrpD
VSDDRFAAFVLSDVEIPQSALEMAATLLIDTIGVAAGAADLEAGRIAREHAFTFHNTGASENAAHMMFDGRKVSVPGAAFAAATQIDNLDGHDGLNPTKGHIGCAVVPALLAFAEARPDLSAREALNTLVIAYEVAARAAFSQQAPWSTL